MAKGDGGISRFRDRYGNLDRNRWRVTVSCGFDPISGKRLRKTKLVTGTKSDARAVRDQMKAQYEEVEEFFDLDKTFGAFADEWQENRVAMGEVCNHTLANGAENIRSLKKYLGKVKLDDITPRMIDATMTKIRKDKEKKLGRPCSGTTMVRTFGTLKQIMQQAVNYDLIARNPCDRANRPKLSKPQRKSLTQEEAQELLCYVNKCTEEAYEEHVAKEQRQKDKGLDEGRISLRGISKMSYLLAVRIGLATGMRKGEVFGLTWDNFDEEKGTLTVEKSATQFHDNQVGMKSPKTESGYRTIHIDPATVEAIIQFRELQLDLLRTLRKVDRNCRTMPSTQPLLCSNVAGMCDLRNFHTWWAKWIKEAGFSGLKFHELRHTQATLLLAKGVDVKTVQTRMGHANAALTLNWYAHPNPENDAKAASLLGSLFAAEQAENSSFEELVQAR